MAVGSVIPCWSAVLPLVSWWHELHGLQPQVLSNVLTDKCLIVALCVVWHSIGCVWVPMDTLNVEV